MEKNLEGPGGQKRFSVSRGLIGRFVCSETERRLKVKLKSETRPSPSLLRLSLGAVEDSIEVSRRDKPRTMKGLDQCFMAQTVSLTPPIPF